MGGLSALADAGQKTLKRINNILKDIDRNPFIGFGKPEP